MASNGSRLDELKRWFYQLHQETHNGKHNADFYQGMTSFSSDLLLLTQYLRLISTVQPSKNEFGESTNNCPSHGDCNNPDPRLEIGSINHKIPIDNRMLEDKDVVNGVKGE